MKLHIQLILMVLACQYSCKLKSRPPSHIMAGGDDCPHLKTFRLAPPPGQRAGDIVTIGDSRARIAGEGVTYYFRYCPDNRTLRAVTEASNRFGRIELENSTFNRFEDLRAVGQAFSEGDVADLQVLLPSRELKIYGDTWQGSSVIMAEKQRRFASLPWVGRLVEVEDIPRPKVEEIEPPATASLIKCDDPGIEPNSFRTDTIEFGDSESFQAQMDVCIDNGDSIAKAEILVVAKSSWNGQLQTDLLQMPGTRLGSVEDIVFQQVSEGTSVTFASERPIGRRVISKIQLDGHRDGSLSLSLDEQTVGQVRFDFGALPTAGACRPGEDIVRNAIEFSNVNGSVTIDLTSCQIFQFGATGTLYYYLLDAEIFDSDPRVAENRRYLEGNDLAEQASLVTTHHNSCDKLEITFPDVQYGFTSPRTFSLGNECEEDHGIAPANPERDALAIRKRVVAAQTSEELSIPWGLGLTFDKEVVLTANSDPL